MTPKEKARELVSKIQEGLWRDRAVKIYQEDAVYSALVVLRDTIWGYLDQLPMETQQYWQDVREELENF